MDTVVKGSNRLTIQSMCEKVGWWITSDPIGVECSFCHNWQHIPEDHCPLCWTHMRGVRYTRTEIIEKKPKSLVRLPFINISGDSLSEMFM